MQIKWVYLIKYQQYSNLVKKYPKYTLSVLCAKEGPVPSRTLKWKKLIMKNKRYTEESL